VKKARLLWIGYSGKGDHAHVEVLRRLRKSDLIEFCVASGAKPQKTDLDVLDSPLISHHHALFAMYENVSGEISGNLDRQTYSLFAPFEGETLRMMDRLHNRGPKFRFHDSFETRRRMFIRHCSFWSGYLKVNKISHIVFNGVPHEVYTFVLLKIAKVFGIATIILHPEKTGIPRKSDGIYYGLYPQKTMHQNVFYVSESIEDIGTWRYSAQIKDSAESLGIEFNIGDPLATTIERVQDLASQPPSVIRSISLAKFIREVTKVSKRPRELLDFSRRAIKSNFQKNVHSRIASAARINQNTAIYFLPYQPEESSSPRAGIFVEQLLAVRSVASCLPEGWTLRVREHPDQYGRRRPRAKGFLKEISLIPKVSLVPFDETVNESFSNVRAAVGVSGTSCVEAWLRKIPVLIFGDMFLKKAPGVFFVETISDIRTALTRIQCGYEFKQIEVDEFISWTSLNSYAGSLQRIDSDIPDLREKTINNLEGIFKSWFHLTSNK